MVTNAVGFTTSSAATPTVTASTTSEPVVTIEAKGAAEAVICGTKGKTIIARIVEPRLLLGRRVQW